MLDGDQVPLRLVILADDPNVSLVEELERRPLWDDQSILERSVDLDGAGLTVTQQAVRVREIRPERDVPHRVVELALDRTAAVAHLAGIRELILVRQHEFDSVLGLMLLPVGHVFEVLFLGYVEIDPHHAVIGQGREDVPLLDQAAELLALAVNDAVERCLDLGKVQFGLRHL